MPAEILSERCNFVFGLNTGKCRPERNLVFGCFSRSHTIMKSFKRKSGNIVGLDSCSNNENLGTNLLMLLPILTGGEHCNFADDNTLCYGCGKE